MTFKTLFSAAALVAASTLQAFAADENVKLDKTLYFDFGAVSTTTYGETTDGADANGNYWNNITNLPDVTNKYALAGTKFEKLIDSKNNSTNYSLTLNSRFSTNGKTAGGGLLNPTADNLGDLAIATATEDYFFIEKSENNSNFTISGLNPDHGYKFYMFASRKATDNRIATYIIEGINKYSGDHQHSGKDLGGSGINQNVKSILASALVYPDDNGNITFTVSRSKGDYIALNAMKIEEYTGGTRPSASTVFTSLTLTGTAAENGVSTPLHEISPDGKHSGKFELFGRLNAGTFKFSGTTTEGKTVTLGADFKTDGADFTATTTGLVYMTVDVTSGKISYTPITSMGLTGSVVPGGWSLTDNANLEYQGEGVWKSTVNLSRTSTVSDPERFVFVMNKSWDYSIKRVAGTIETVGLGSNGYTLEDIRLNHGTYVVTLDLRNYVYKIDSPDGKIDPLRISVMGSSVANGQGATDNHGYAYMYGEMLQQRFNDNLSENKFYTSGIAINGNSTVNVLARYNDLIHEFGKYVIFGLSLGNEGIHGASNQDKIFNQFRDNMQLLISKARTDGKYPVVMNNYTRGDYNESDYEYVKKMNLLIHEWDLPSVNTLGAIDNGNGRWADGYQNGDDIYHPSTEGHREFFYAMTPSLFDAIAAGKDIPARDAANSYALKKDEILTFSPEGSVHPFTFILKFKSADAAQLFTIDTEDGIAKVAVKTDGTVEYTAPSGKTISGSMAAAADGWNYISLTCYYAQGVTKLYSGSTLVGETADRIAPQKFTVGDASAAIGNTLSEMFFYRSAMNVEEIGTLVGGKMLKSSLEIYLPFSSTSPLNNVAQSLNTVSSSSKSSVQAVSAGDMKIYTTPGVLHIVPNKAVAVNVYGIDGTSIISQTISQASSYNLSSGIYIVNNNKVYVK